MEFLVMFALLLILSITALRFGVDSSETFNSPEWEHRHHWHTN